MHPRSSLGHQTTPRQAPLATPWRRQSFVAATWVNHHIKAFRTWRNRGHLRLHPLCVGVRAEQRLGIQRLLGRLPHGARWRLQAACGASHRLKLWRRFNAPRLGGMHRGGMTCP